MNSKNEEKLRDLGFPEGVIRESLRAEERGLFEIKPPTDLVERTIERCRNRLRVTQSNEKQMTAAVLEQAIAAFAGKVIAAQKADAELSEALQAFSLTTNARAIFNRIERLPIDCLATATFAQTRRLRPMMMVDNHNVINPSWWEFDSGLLAFRSACRAVSTIAQNDGVLPAAVLMVLRPKISDYTPEDFAAIGNLIGSAASDVWMLPYDKAGEYQNQDIIVFGQERVLSLQGDFASPSDAFGAFRELDNRSAAIAVRGNIEHATQAAVALKPSSIRGWEDARTLIQGIIKSNAASRAAT